MRTQKRAHWLCKVESWRHRRIVRDWKNKLEIAEWRKDKGKSRKQEHRVEGQESGKSWTFLEKNKKFPGVHVWGQEVGGGEARRRPRPCRAREAEFILKAAGRQKKCRVREKTQSNLVFRKITQAPRWQIDFMSNASSDWLVMRAWRTAWRKTVWSPVSGLSSERATTD